MSLTIYLAVSKSLSSSRLASSMSNPQLVNKAPLVLTGDTIDRRYCEVARAGAIVARIGSGDVQVELSPDLIADGRTIRC